MIELFKKELAQLNNDGYIYEGYWQFRQLAEMCDQNSAYFEACMERFKEFPVGVIESEILETSISSSKLYSLNELLRLREAAQENPRYWTTIFIFFVNDEKHCYHFRGIRMALDSIVHSIRYYFTKWEGEKYIYIGESLFAIIKYCLSNDFDECDAGIDEIVSLATQGEISPESFREMQKRISETYPESRTQNWIDEDKLEKLDALRKAFNLPPMAGQNAN